MRSHRSKQSATLLSGNNESERQYGINTGRMLSLDFSLLESYPLYTSCCIAYPGKVVQIGCGRLSICRTSPSLSLLKERNQSSCPIWDKSLSRRWINLSLVRRGAAGGEVYRRKRSLESFNGRALTDFCLMDSSREGFRGGRHLEKRLIPPGLWPQDWCRFPSNLLVRNHSQHQSDCQELL